MNAASSSGSKPDFIRLGDLLGEACEEPGQGPVGPEATAAESSRTSTRQAPPVGVPVGRRVATGVHDPARMLALIWPDIVGAEVAANAHPVQLRGGRLTVSASSAAWAQTLQFMSEDICARLQETLGRGAVKQVVFRHAGWEEPAPRSPRRPPSETPPQEPVRSPEGPAKPGDRPLSPEQTEALAALEALDLPGDLRARIARAMEAAFVRGEQGRVR